MQLFDYVGQLESGASLQGTLEADNEARARDILHEMGVRTISLRAARRNAFVAPLSLDDFQFLNEHIASLTRSGVPLEEGLRQAAADVGSGKLKRLMMELADDLTRGTPLPNAIEAIEKRFPTHYATVVKAGLKSGDLAGTLYGLSAHLRLAGATKRALVELAAYPLAVLILAMCVLSLLMRVIVPQVALIVADMFGFTDPSIRQFISLPRNIPLISAYTFVLARYWPTIEIVLWCIIALILFVLVSSPLPLGRNAREWLLWRIPGVARAYGAGVRARFAHTCALGAHAGLPLPDLVSAAGAASGSNELAKAANRAAQRLSTGESLEAATEDEPLIPALWTCVVRAAAPRGELATALAELARSYESRAEHWVRMLRILLGPVLLLFVGTFLGLVIVGIGATFAYLIQSLTN